MRLAAELKEVHEIITASPRAERVLLRERKRALCGRILERLGPEKAPGLLGELRKRHLLHERHLLAILLLLSDRIAGGTQWTSGRQLLETMGQDVADMIDDLWLLNDESPLFTRDIVRHRGLITDSPLECEYRISEWIFQIFCEEMQRRREPEDMAESGVRPGPYLSTAAHLLDMKRLVELHQIRAAGVFDDSSWREYYPEADSISGDVPTFILQARYAITERESSHGHGVHLPVVAFRNEYALTEEEEIIVLALLFHELFSGPPFLDAGELIRLVSASEEDVFRKRRLLSRGSRLREQGLVIVESEVETKELVGEAYTADWVEERLLEGIEDAAAIDADECQTFHRYLQRLRNSDDFYRNL